MIHLGARRSVPVGRSRKVTMEAHDATPFPRILLLGAFALSGAAVLS